MESQGNGIMSGIHLPHEEEESVVSSKGKLRIVNIVTSFNMTIFQICLRLSLSTHPRKNVHGAYGICNTKLEHYQLCYSQNLYLVTDFNIYQNIFNLDWRIKKNQK